MISSDNEPRLKKSISPPPLTFKVAKIAKTNITTYIFDDFLASIVVFSLEVQYVLA